MDSQLSHIFAQEHQAELIRAAERHRLAGGAQPSGASSPAGSSPVRRRFRIALPIIGRHAEAPAAEPRARPPFRRATLVEVRAHAGAEEMVDVAARVPTPRVAIGARTEGEAARCS